MPAVQEAILDRLGWLDAPAHFTRPDRRPRGLRRRRSSTQGYTTAIVAGMGGSSLAPDVLHRTFGAQDGYLALRILDSTDPAYVAATLDDLDPLRTLDDRRLQVRHDDRAERLPRRRVDAGRGRPRRRGHHHLRPARRVHRGRHGPGQEPRGDRPPRRLPRGLPQPARHRRPVLGADLRRARAGVADRPGPRRAAGLRDRRCSAPAASRTLSRNPGVSLGLAIGTLAAERPRQADVPDRRRDRQLRGVAGAAHRREHRQARRRDRPGRPRAARRRRDVRHGPRLRPARPGRLGRPADADEPSPTALEAAGHPVIRIALQRPDRPRRRVRGAGRSRRRSPGPSSASTRSTSPTSRRPSSSPATCSPRRGAIEPPAAARRRRRR